jgi:hypothetical protein
MCNPYACEIEAERIIKMLQDIKDAPAFEWEAGHT